MQPTTTDNRLGIDEYEAAALLGLSVHTLRKDRTGVAAGVNPSLFAGEVAVLW